MVKTLEESSSLSLGFLTLTLTLTPSKVPDLQVPEALTFHILIPCTAVPRKTCILSIEGSEDVLGPPAHAYSPSYFGIPGMSSPLPILHLSALFFLQLLGSALPPL